nr:exodeoxyribonuclease III [Pseudobdellovibrionaceae bacterium]
MKIISWNVNGIRACLKKDLMSFVRKYQPDILCLQETKAHKDQVEPEGQCLGKKYSYWSSAKKKGYSGVATFCDQEPHFVQTGIGFSQYEDEGRIVVTDHGHFLLYNIYFPNGGSGEERHKFKQQFLKDLYLHLKTDLDQGKSIVVVGDYNIAHTENDIYDPIRLANESGFLPEERDWMSRFLELGFIDTFRFLQPDQKN